MPSGTEPTTPEQQRIDARRLAGETLCSERTVRRWLAHERVHRSNAAVLTKAAQKLGIRRPPAPAPPLPEAR